MEINFSNAIEFLGGLCIIIYAVFQGFKKLFGDMKWYKELFKEKREKKLKKAYEDYKLFREWNKEDRKQEFSEFYDNYKEAKKDEEETYLKGLYDVYTEQFVEKYEEKVIDKIEDTDKTQNEKIDKLITSSNDMLRKELVTIYYRYFPYKKITIYMRKSFMKLYEDYHEQGGNSFIDDIHAQVITWQIVDTEEEVTMGEVKN